MKTMTRIRNEEDGVAIIFGLLMGLVGFGLAYAMMLSTITSLNVASVAMTTSRLQQAAETGVNEAMTLINAGYNFKVNTISNPFTGVDRITHQSTNVQTSNIHWEWWVTPFDLTNRSDCQQSGTSVNYNCGYYLYSKATMPEMSSTAQVTVRAILVPTPIASASKDANGGLIYTARNVSLARHGIYGLNKVQLNQGVQLYSYYSVDSNAGAPLPTLSTESNNKASLASNKDIIIQNTSFTDSRIAAYNRYYNGTNATEPFSTCTFNGACNEDKWNQQRYAFSLASHEDWAVDACTSYNNDFTLNSPIPSGVTCLNGDITLDSNIVQGNANTPSILIINGSLSFTPNAQLNIDKAPSFLQIYVNGDVTMSSQESSESKISAIIMASGTNTGKITISSSSQGSKINLYGTLVGNEITASGNVTIWQDLNTKYLKNTTDNVAYQFFSLEITSAVRDNIPISIIGDIYGEGFTIDSGANNLGVGQ